MSASLPNIPQPPSPLTPGEIEAYLAYACEALIARRNAVIASLQADFKAHPVINDDATLGEIAENIRMAYALNKTGDDRRKEHKEPFLNGGRAVDGWFKRWGASLESAIAPVQLSMNAFGERKLIAQRKQAEADKKIADAAAEAAQRAASQALREGQPHDASEALDRVAETAEAAEDADARVHARPADLTRTYGSFGAVASVRQKWNWRVISLDRVPRKYLMIDVEALKLAAKSRDATGKPTAVIPGIAWVADTTVGVR